MLTVNVGIDMMNASIPYIYLISIFIRIPFMQLNEYSLNFRMLIGNSFVSTFYISVGMQMYMNNTKEIAYTTNAIIILFNLYD
jgi:hypothetical protein